jgi:hypothetical protein
MRGQASCTAHEERGHFAPDHYTLRLGSDGKVALRADCNRGMGSNSVTADRPLPRRWLGPIRAARWRGGWAAVLTAENMASDTHSWSIPSFYVFMSI